LVDLVWFAVVAVVGEASLCVPQLSAAEEEATPRSRSREVVVGGRVGPTERGGGSHGTVSSDGRPNGSTYLCLRV
jgi:hypothetical protein